MVKTRERRQKEDCDEDLPSMDKVGIWSEKEEIIEIRLDLSFPLTRKPLSYKEWKYPERKTVPDVGQ